MKKTVIATTVACVMGAASFGCSAAPGSEPTSETTLKEDNGNHYGNLPFQIDSPDFTNGGAMPAADTCEGHAFGSGLSPELDWTQGPNGTKSYAIVLRDTSISNPNLAFHWAIWNIPHDLHALPAGLEGVGADPVVQFPDGMKGAEQVQARGFTRYFPPCPAWPVARAIKCNLPVPDRNTDSYTFTIYALPEHELTVPAYDPAVNPNYVDQLNTLFDSMDLDHVSVAFTSNAVPDPNGLPPNPAFACP